VKRFMPVMLVLLLMTACSDSDLNKISKALVVTAKTNGEIQTDVIAANTAQLLSDSNTRVILEMCQKVNYAGKEATTLTRSINALDAPSKAQILTILKPIIVAVGNVVDKGLVGVTDEPTKQKIRLLLLSLQSTLNSIQIIVAGGA
jgi:hypothetical protein